MQSEKSKKYITSFFIILFWCICIFEIYGLREDYPFSYFGMYKTGVSPAPFVKVDINVNGDLLGSKYVDPYFLQDKIKEILLGDISGAIEKPHEEPSRVFYEMDSIAYQKLSALVQEEVVEKIRKTSINKSRIDVQIIYREWKLLSYETHSVPDVNKIIFNQSFEVVQ